MYMGMVPLIVKRSVPAEVLQRNIHGGSDIISVCPQESTPRLDIVIPQAGGVLTLQGEDVRPYI